MNLFIHDHVMLASGKHSAFKIECDALTNADWECLAYLISEGIEFYNVSGVPTGGNILAKELEKYINSDAEHWLVVDDVLTTGNSMEEERERVSRVHASGGDVVGYVVFARGKCPDWITPLFQMQPLKPA